MSQAARDTLGRPLSSLRLSVTDRCNLRCRYCMPEDAYTWLPRADLLDFEELERAVAAFVEVGVRELHLTGGEPLLRRELPALVRRLTSLAGLEDVALTTNGVLLADHAVALREAGLHRITVSLDTLRPDRFVTLSRRDEHARVLAGLEAARAAGFEHLGVNAVIMRGFNDDELGDLVAFGRRHHLEVRFIEYMDVGGATRWTPAGVLGQDEMLRRLEPEVGPIRPLPRDSSPAARYELEDGSHFGIIAPVTSPFCRACDRARLTSDGVWYLCLYATQGLDLRTPLRAAASHAELVALLRRHWEGRTDRGAELRASLTERHPLHERAELEADLHLEMHARGG
jgi:cyclic pyranopterin phosphate synthase